MTRTLVLDVYGTLVDPAGITLAPRQDAGESTGVSTAWVRRSKEKLYDPWGMAPDIVTASLLELGSRLPA